ncbi:lymphocyte cytosolic protein 2-like [Venturia canescens]|uniref:lymphocyte cytosolic protein 2-like n=1 Tax=Venturia canescens TaxID=32260 RepID=UPI001C9BFBCD|nr:lymphocyte cytosolic protein 2-like [Venturia canescens]
MSKTLSRIVALEQISNWNTNDVVSLLRKNGLGDCCKAVHKRQIDGDEFLHLTEGKLALWKSDLTRPLTWSLWRFVEDLKKTPEKYATEKKESGEEKNEESMSDTGSWGTDFEDDVDEDEAEEEDSAGNWRPNGSSSTNNHSGGKSSASTVQSCSRNSEFRNSLMIFRENEKTSILSREKEASLNKGKRRVDEEVAESTYTNCCETEVDDGAEQDESTYANCVKAEELLAATKSKNVSNLHGKAEKTLAEQLKEQLRLINSRKTRVEMKKEIIKAPPILEKSSLEKKPVKSFLHDVAPSLSQQIFHENILPVGSTNVEELEKNLNADKCEAELPRPPLTIRNFDLVANLPTRTEESEDEYEPFDEQIIEQNKRLSLARVDSKLSLGSARQGSLESVYKTPSITSQDKQDEEYEIYESITETPEENGYYPQPMERDKVIRNGPPPLPAKPAISLSPNSQHSGSDKKQRERSPDKKSATLPHSGSSTSLTAELRATRPLPPPPDKQSYMDLPWFHNVTREQATALIKDRAYGNAENGYFLLRPSTSHPNNPLALVLWFKDRVYNVPVRKRPDNRYALGSAKINEQSFSCVEEIVRFYSREELMLHSGGVQAGSTKLTDTPPK